MVIKELIGIYLGKDALHYCCAARTVSSWQMEIPGAAMDPSGVLHGASLTTLRDFLQRFSPKTGRRIFLALPRSRFFVRDIQLPPVPMEDALASVQSMLPVTVHLPTDDVYHDIFLCRAPDGKVNALVIYALRKEIQQISEIFREIGHERSLAGLFPVSIGIGAWLSLQEYVMPMGLMISHEGTASELSIFQQSGCIYSTVWQKAWHADETSAGMLESTCAKFHLPDDNVYGLYHAEGCPPLPEPLVDKLPWLPSIHQNPGVAGLAAALSGQQRILLDGLPRIKVFRLWKLFVPVVLFLTVVVFAVTVQMNGSIERKGVLVSAMKEEVQQLQQQIRPYEKTRDAINRAKSLSADIADFIRLRPRLFTCFNEIARLVPEGTWFSRTIYQGAELTLQGQSREALKVVESLRTSALFEQVKLSGSVSRNPSGTEQFSLVIRLKDVDATP